MSRLDQVAPTIDQVGGDSGELYSLQGGSKNCGPSTGIYGDYMGIYDAVREVLGSDLKVGDLDLKSILNASAGRN